MIGRTLSDVQRGEVNERSYLCLLHGVELFLKYLLPDDKLSDHSLHPFNYVHCSISKVLIWK